MVAYVELVSDQTTGNSLELGDQLHVQDQTNKYIENNQSQVLLSEKEGIKSQNWNQSCQCEFIVYNKYGQLRYRNKYKGLHIHRHTHISQLYLLQGSGSSITSKEIFPHTQILAPKHSTTRNQDSLEQMADFSTGIEKEHDEPGTFCCNRSLKNEFTRG